MHARDAFLAAVFGVCGAFFLRHKLGRGQRLNCFLNGFNGNRKTGDFANMDSLKTNIENFLKSGPLLYLTHSHIFVDNHDKPLAPFCLALDMGAYLSRFGINSGSDTNEDDIKRAKQAAERGQGERGEIRAGSL